MIFPFGFLGGSYTPSTEALAWKTRIESNGGIIPTPTLQIFDRELITPAVAAGIWSELDRLNVYCGLNGFEIAARTNLIKNAHYVTPVSSPIFNNNGYASGGTGYLNLNYNFATQAVKFTRDSAIFGYCAFNPTFSGSPRPMGSLGGGSSRNDCERDANGSTGSVNTSGGLS